MFRRVIITVISFLIFSLLSGACTSTSTTAIGSPAETTAPAYEVNPTAIPTTPANPEIILATTTSTRDSGLLDVLLPLFDGQTGYKVKMVAVGSGQALVMGQEGSADVLLVHAPASEIEFMAGGYGLDRYLVMHNDFIMIGPSEDPAKVKDLVSTKDVFTAISNTKSIFVSRGDDSGTNKAELKLWKSVEITPVGDWYLVTGQGMGDTLRIASEKAGYTFTDRATFLSMKDSLDLTILFEGDKDLLNIYHIITVNPTLWPNANYKGAKTFADWMVSEETQKVIAEFGVDKYGQALFIADAGKPEDKVK